MNDAGSTDSVNQDSDPWRDEPPGVTEARDDRALAADTDSVKSLPHFAGYRGRYKTPRSGTPLRRAFDAAHAVWCGPECPPSCREWHPDVDEMEALLRGFSS